MNKLLEKIRSRGYWRVIIRPGSFVEKRVPEISSLYPILEKTSVQLRGWDFPHLDTKSPLQIDLDWIGQEIRWNQYQELWRFYQSGQFVHISALTEDWVKESALLSPYYDWDPGRYLLVRNAVFRFTEIFEFAARLAQTKAGDEVMRVETTVFGLKGRELKLGESTGDQLVSPPYKASIEEFPYTIDLSRIQLITETAELALKAAAELFQRFGWNPSLEILRDMQDDLLHRRAGVTAS